MNCLASSPSPKQSNPRARHLSKRGGFDAERPSVGGRLGLRPGAAWRLGLSASHGPYMTPSAPDRGSPLATLARDLRYAWRSFRPATHEAHDPSVLIVLHSTA